MECKAKMAMHEAFTRQVGLTRASFWVARKVDTLAWRIRTKHEVIGLLELLCVTLASSAQSSMITAIWNMFLPLLLLFLDDLLLFTENFPEARLVPIGPVPWIILFIYLQHIPHVFFQSVPLPIEIGARGVEKMWS